MRSAAEAVPFSPGQLDRDRLIVLCAVMGIASDKFFTLRNWLNLLTNFSVVGIVAIGVTVVLIAGGLDLSFGPILACCAILATLFQPSSFWLAILLPPLLGAALGSVNGIIIARAGTNPLITTLGTQWLFYSALDDRHRRPPRAGKPEDLFPRDRLWQGSWHPLPADPDVSSFASWSGSSCGGPFSVNTCTPTARGSRP